MSNTQFSRNNRGWASALFLITFLGACASPTKHIANLAREADVSIEQVAGDRYAHLLFRNRVSRQIESSQPLLIFLEGDGLPWIKGGSQPSADPTPRHPLAFNLFLKSDQPAWYITRPCYNSVRTHCTEEDWTHGRYSEQVVSSFIQAIRSQLITRPHQRVILIGYSGGGVLATLIAARLSQADGIISIASNLDTQAWTELHGYEPLNTSLNPVDLAPLSMPQLVLSGDRDTNVPLTTLTRYLERQPRAIVRHFESYDHVCCWEKDWPTLLSGSLKQLDLTD